jgi:tungstate transport system substrate-binding protein
MIFFIRLVATVVIALVISFSAKAEPFITVASTTSTEQSGLFTHLLPIFKKASGIDVRVVALGTGQALDVARRGDADVVLVHDKAAEEKFVAEGFGVARIKVMYNDFVLIGSKDDPTRVAGRDIAHGMQRIAERKPPFVSRADKSGTHAAELRYWALAGVDIAKIKGDWYRELGAGMGQTLNTASAINAYSIADRATWLSFKNQGALTILVEGDARLFNQYAVILANPSRHPHIKKVEAQQFIDWLVSPAGQAAIASFQINGMQLFFPNAEPKRAIR